MSIMTWIGRASAAIFVTALAGCGQPVGNTADAQDPLEPVNRSVHAFNKGLDRTVLKPTSEAYVAIVPRPLREGVSNGSENLSQPLYFVNHVLQGDIRSAMDTFFRFGMNTVLGVGGIADPATDAGIPERPTDFGETLAVWGIDSGPYVELPVFGPSTARDSVGLVVDFIIDPVGRTVPGEYRGYLIGADVAALLQTRQDFARVVEALLYESADSYNASRIAYLQNRAAALNDGQVIAEDLEDIYAFE